MHPLGASRDAPGLQDRQEHLKLVDIHDVWLEREAGHTLVRLKVLFKRTSLTAASFDTSILVNARRLAADPRWHLDNIGVQQPFLFRGITDSPRWREIRHRRKAPLQLRSWRHPRQDTRPLRRARRLFRIVSSACAPEIRVRAGFHQEAFHSKEFETLRARWHSRIHHAVPTQWPEIW